MGVGFTWLTSLPLVSPGLLARREKSKKILTAEIFVTARNFVRLRPGSPYALPLLTKQNGLDRRDRR
jgi:hypothetical protein